MLTGITTRASTPHEDAGPWPGGSARPVLGYLSGAPGMTGAGARETAEGGARRAGQGRAGHAGDYPVPGGDAHLLIHYAPGSRACRFKLTDSGNDVPPSANAAPDAEPGNLAAPDGPLRGRETLPGSPAGDAGSAPVAGLPGPPGGAAEPGPAKITVTVAHDAAGRHVAMLDGYQPGDPVVAVFACQADSGRPAEEIADEAFDAFNDHPGDPTARTSPAPITDAGCGRCRSPETHRVAAGRVAFTVAPCGPDHRRGRRASGRPASVSQVQGGRTDD